MTVPIDKHFGRQAFGLNPAAYHSARPAYPDWVYEMLVARCGLRPGSKLFEIGAGMACLHRGGVADWQALKRVWHCVAKFGSPVAE